MAVSKKNLEYARALYYELFARFFVYYYQDGNLEDLDTFLAKIVSNPLDSHSENAIKNILNTINHDNTSAISQEFDEIFYSPTEKRVGSSASYYEDGVEFSKKCVDVKNILAKTTIRRNEKIFKEPEDSVGFIFILMSNLIQSKDKLHEVLERELFCDILNPFIDEFIVNIHNHNRAKTYKDVAILLNSFMEFERLYFETTKVKRERQNKREDGISLAEAQRRATNRARKEADKKNKGENNGRKTR